MKTIGRIVLLLVMTILISIPVFADDTLLNESGSISQNETIEKNIVVPSKGEVTLFFKGYTNPSDSSHQHIQITIYDNDDKQIKYYSMDDDSHKTNDSFMLAKGNYKIEIRSCLQWYRAFEGTYDIRVHFASSNSTYNEEYSNLHNSFDKADTVTLGTAIKGAICENDDIDYYKVSLNNPGILNFTTSSFDLERCYLYLYDKNNSLINSYNPKASSGQLNNKEKISLLSGDYYFVIQRNGEYGNYTFSTQLTPVDLTVNETETELLNNTEASASIVDVSEQIKGLLTYNNQYDYYKVTFSSKGELRATSNINIYVYDKNTGLNEYCYKNYNYCKLKVNAGSTIIRVNVGTDNIPDDGRYTLDFFPDENSDPTNPTNPDDPINPINPDPVNPVNPINPNNNEEIITVSSNKPMDYYSDYLDIYQIFYYHTVPFYGKSKIDVSYFGDMTISYNGMGYKVTKIKVNKKKHTIQITGIDGFDKETIKEIKKATKGVNGLKFNVNPYYITDNDDVTIKTKKDGSIKSISVKINGKNYKLKKTEWTLDMGSQTLYFKGNNVTGSLFLELSNHQPSNYH